MNGRRTLLEVALLFWTGSLIALIGLQCFVFAPLATPTATVFVFVAQTAPLVAVAPAVLALRKARAPLWMALVSLLYFVHGVSRAAIPAERLSGALEVVFALGLLATCLALARRR